MDLATDNDDYFGDEELDPLAMDAAETAAQEALSQQSASTSPNLSGSEQPPLHTASPSGTPNRSGVFNPGRTNLTFEHDGKVQGGFLSISRSAEGYHCPVKDCSLIASRLDGITKHLKLRTIHPPSPDLFSLHFTKKSGTPLPTASVVPPEASAELAVPTSADQQQSDFPTQVDEFLSTFQLYLHVAPHLVISKLTNVALAPTHSALIAHIKKHHSHRFLRTTTSAQVSAFITWLFYMCPTLVPDLGTVTLSLQPPIPHLLPPVTGWACPDCPYRIAIGTVNYLKTWKAHTSPSNLASASCPRTTNNPQPRRCLVQQLRSGKYGATPYFEVEGTGEAPPVASQQQTSTVDSIRALVEAQRQQVSTTLPTPNDRTAHGQAWLGRLRLLSLFANVDTTLVKPTYEFTDPDDQAYLIDTILPMFEQVCTDANNAVLNAPLSGDVRQGMRTSRTNQHLGLQFGAWQQTTITNYLRTMRTVFTYLVVASQEPNVVPIPLPTALHEDDEDDSITDLLDTICDPAQKHKMYSSIVSLMYALLKQPTVNGETTSLLYFAVAATYGYNIKDNTFTKASAFSQRLAHILYFLRCFLYYIHRFAHTLKRSPPTGPDADNSTNQPSLAPAYPADSVWTIRLYQKECAAHGVERSGSAMGSIMALLAYVKSLNPNPIAQVQIDASDPTRNRFVVNGTRTSFDEIATLGPALQDALGDCLAGLLGLSSRHNLPPLVDEQGLPAKLTEDLTRHTTGYNMVVANPHVVVDDTLYLRQLSKLMVDGKPCPRVAKQHLAKIDKVTALLRANFHLICGPPPRVSESTILQHTDSPTAPRSIHVHSNTICLLTSYSKHLNNGLAGARQTNILRFGTPTLLWYYFLFLAHVVPVRSILLSAIGHPLDFNYYVSPGKVVNGVVEPIDPRTVSTSLSKTVEPFLSFKLLPQAWRQIAVFLHKQRGDSYSFLMANDDNNHDDHDGLDNNQQAHAAMMGHSHRTHVIAYAPELLNQWAAIDMEKVTLTYKACLTHQRLLGLGQTATFDKPSSKTRPHPTLSPARPRTAPHPDLLSHLPPPTLPSFHATAITAAPPLPPDQHDIFLSTQPLPPELWNAAVSLHPEHPSTPFRGDQYLTTAVVAACGPAPLLGLPLLVVLRTGVGKSLVPLVAAARCRLRRDSRPRAVVVVCLTKSLKADMIARNQDRYSAHLRTEGWRSSSQMATRPRENMSLPELLIVTFEEALTDVFQQFFNYAVANSRIDRVVVDEAHQLVTDSGWRTVLFRASWINKYSTVPVIYLTGTFPASFLHDFKSVIRAPRLTIVRSPQTIVSGGSAPTVFVKTVKAVKEVTETIANTLIAADQRHYGAPPTVIFMWSKAELYKLKGLLEAADLPNVRVYHSEEDPAKAAKLAWDLNDFLSKGSTILITTVGAAMGLDRTDVRNVLVGGYPAGLAIMEQMKGRGGRDLLGSRCTFVIAKSQLRGSMYDDIDAHAGRQYLATEGCRQAVSSLYLDGVSLPCTSTGTPPCDNCQKSLAHATPLTSAAPTLFSLISGQHRTAPVHLLTQLAVTADICIPCAAFPCNSAAHPSAPSPLSHSYTSVDNPMDNCPVSRLTSSQAYADLVKRFTEPARPSRGQNIHRPDRCYSCQLPSPLCLRPRTSTSGSEDPFNPDADEDEYTVDEVRSPHCLHPNLAAILVILALLIPPHKRNKAPHHLFGYPSGLILPTSFLNAMRKHLPDDGVLPLNEPFPFDLLDALEESAPEAYAWPRRGSRLNVFSAIALRMMEHAASVLWE